MKIIGTLSQAVTFYPPVKYQPIDLSFNFSFLAVFFVKKTNYFAFNEEGNLQKDLLGLLPKCKVMFALGMNSCRSLLIAMVHGQHWHLHPWPGKAVSIRSSLNLTFSPKGPPGFLRCTFALVCANCLLRFQKCFCEMVPAFPGSVGAEPRGRTLPLPLLLFLHGADFGGNGSAASASDPVVKVASDKVI